MNYRNYRDQYVNSRSMCVWEGDIQGKRIKSFIFLRGRWKIAAPLWAQRKCLNRKLSIRSIFPFIQLFICLPIHPLTHPLTHLIPILEIYCFAEKFGVGGWSLSFLAGGLERKGLRLDIGTKYFYTFLVTSANSAIWYMEWV